MKSARSILIYSCSGCSSAAQLANHLALRMDRAGVAEMSCIAGVGGDVKPLVRTAQSGRPVAVLDGCPLHCARHTLARHGVVPDLHWALSAMEVEKRKHVDFNPADAARLEPALTMQLQQLPVSANESACRPHCPPPPGGRATTRSICRAKP